MHGGENECKRSREHGKFIVEADGWKQHCDGCAGKDQVEIDAAVVSSVCVDEDDAKTNEDP